MEFFLLFIGEILSLFLLSKSVTKELSYLFLLLTKSKKTTVYLLSLLFLPGTIIHELSHMFMALLLFVPVGQLQLFPAVEGQSVTLGTVQIAKTDIFRRFLIGVAPFLFGVSLILMLLFYWQGNIWLRQGWSSVFIGYAVFVIANTMYSSKRDMEGAIELLVATTLLLVLGFVIGVKFKLPIELTAAVQAIVTSSVVRWGSMLLLVCLGIDLVFLLVLKVLKKVTGF